MTRTILRALTLACLNFASTPLFAIEPGNIVIYRVGTGSAALGTTATAIFLDEYRDSGLFVSSTPLASTGSTAITAVGNATTEGIMSRAQDGNSLIFTGYRKDAGGTNPSSDAPATTNRVIGTLNASGTINTSIALTNTTGTIRSATTVDGSGPYYISTSTAVQYVATPGPAATATSIDARNSRQVNLSGNTLYASNGSTTITGKVQSYGTLPTGTTAASPVVTLGLNDAVNGFFLCDLSSSIPGDDTMYVLSTVQSQLQKYTFNGTAWTASGSVASSASNITGVVDGNNNAILFTTSASTLSRLVDTSGYNATLSGSLTPIATAPTLTGFRGIGIMPVPEPSILALAGLIGIGLLRRRRR